jgi:hypothetical protein
MRQQVAQTCLEGLRLFKRKADLALRPSRNQFAGSHFFRVYEPTVNPKGGLTVATNSPGGATDFVSQST